MILSVYETRLRALPDVEDLRDPKTRLQEWLQSRRMNLPEYELVSVTGKAHKRRFEVSCAVEEASLVTAGQSTTRRKAEQKAAADMLAALLEADG